MASTPSSRHCRHRERSPRDHRRRGRHHPAASETLLKVGGALGSRSGRGGRRSSMGALLSMVVGVVLSFSVLLLVPVAEAMGKNDDIASNVLGLLVKSCAASYCGVGVTGLDLWLSLEEKCDVESTPSLTALWANGGSGAVTDLGGNWSPTSAALVCVCVWSVLAYAGFKSGVRVGTRTKGGYPVA